MSAWLDSMGAPDWTFIQRHWSAEFFFWKLDGYLELARKKAPQQEAE